MEKKLLVIMTIIVILAFIISGCSPANVSGQDEQNEEKYIPVEIEECKKIRLAEITTLSGKVLPEKDIMVFSEVPGKVSEVKVGVGDSVRKGQLLFRLDEDDIRDKVKQAKAAFELANANYQMSKEKIENAKINLERTRELYKQGAVSKSQLEQAEIAASDNSLKLLEAQLNQAEISYKQALEALENLAVTSPIDGVVSNVNVEEGEMVSNTQPAVTIVNVDKIHVLVNVTENIVALLKEGQKVTVNIPALGDKTFSGNIDSISPTTDARTQLYPVKIYLDNSKGVIKPGMFARVNLETKVRENVIAVRSQSVVLNNGSIVVYVVEDGVAKLKEVSTGLDTGTYVEIKAGLKEHEKVIVKGQNYVKDGIKVKVVGGK